MYKTLYDLSAQPSANRGLVLMAIGLVVATMIAFAISRFPFLQYSLLSFTVLVSIFGIVMPCWDRHRLKNKLAASSCRVVEGTITNHWENEWYDSDSDSRNSYEAFQVGNVSFGYYRSVEMAGFHNQEGNTITIRDGMTVRIHYVPERQLDDGSVQNRIVKLEAQDEFLVY